MPTEFRGSEAGRCSRWLALKLNGQQPKPFSRQQEITMADSAAHEDLIIMQLLKDHPIAISRRQQQVVLEQGQVRIVGHIDGMLTCTKDSPDDHLLEMKALSQFSFASLRSMPVRKYSEEYFQQVQSYLWAMQPSGPQDCWFVVKNKNTGEIIIKKISADAEAIAKNIARLADILVAVKFGELPAEECQFLDRRYSWCNYNKYCHQEQEVAATVTEAEVLEAAEIWHRAKALQNEYEELMESARGAFENYMRRRGLRGMKCADLQITLSDRERTSLDEEKLKTWLSAIQLDQARKITPYSELRVREIC